MALPFFAATLFVSAFLLFLVQPIIGKMILPRLGGTPQVWNTCMMFFQIALLAGYAYTHTVSTRLTLRRQLIVHSILLLVPLIILLPGGPFNITNWVPPPGANPIFSTLLLLTVIVGIPFFVVATSAPLLQKWFAYTGHPAAKDPYFLYGASNFGSMLGLLAYPFVIEPLFRLQAPIVDGHVTFDPGAQSWIWTLGYILLVILVGGCAFMAWKAPPSVQLAGAAVDEPPPAVFPEASAPLPEPVTQIKANAPAPRATGIKKGSKQRGRQTQRPATRPAAPAAAPEPPAPPRPYQLTFWRRLRWVGLAAVPSSLMLGITTYISTDISAIPLFWIIPLVFYLLSFILVFLRWPVIWTDIPHKVVLFVQPLALLALIFYLVRGGGFQPAVAILLCMSAFFLTALMCHGELARDRPPTKYLTEFYLWMSVGGMVGGVFNGLIAPVAFTGLLEFPLALVFAGLLRPQMKSESWIDSLVIALFPGFGESVANAGDDLARGARPQPGTEPRPAVNRRDLPPRGYLLHHALDIILPLLIGLVAAFIISRAISRGAWNWQYIYPADFPQAVKVNMKNPLFAFWHSSVGFGPGLSRLLATFLFNVIAYGIPLGACLLWYGRPLRFALGIAAILLVGYLGVGVSLVGLGVGIVLVSAGLVVLLFAQQGLGALLVGVVGWAFTLGLGIWGLAGGGHVYASSREDTLLRAERSYFGILKVRESVEQAEDGTIVASYTYLMHGTTHHGLNYQEPPRLRRLATTYYHKNGPVGVVMRAFDPLPAPVPSDVEAEKKDSALKNWNSFWSDARLPTSVIGSALAPMSGGLNPALAQMPAVISTWSDPPYACVGLGTGTMASYARPFQSMTFYEIDEHIRNFSFNNFQWPPTPAAPNGKDAPFFNYVQDAKARGARLEVAMGDARLRMAQPWLPRGKEADLRAPWEIGRDERGGPDHYYRAIELDAFSSDAIPVHLITKEAIQMYFTKLMKPRDVERRDRDGKVMKDKDGNPILDHFSGGVLMVHTSNRHVDLVKPVTDVARALGLKWRVGKDHYDRTEAGEDPSNRGRFSSEYVMLAEDERDLPRETPPEQANATQLLWSTPAAPGNRVWTDDFSNLMSVFRW